MTRAQTSRDFFHLDNRARTLMIEAIMRIEGYGQPNAKAYRQHLMVMDDKELNEFYHELWKEII